jgi:hypothetical protein
MTESRRQILKMLAEGKITTDEADQLLAAAERAPTPAAQAPDEPERRNFRPKYLRVMVDTTEDESGRPGGKPTKVNIRVPMQLLRAGVRLSSLIPEPARAKANEALREQGVPFDLNQLKPENLEDLIEQISDLTVDVDQEETRVRVFCE